MGAGSAIARYVGALAGRREDIMSIHAVIKATFEQVLILLLDLCQGCPLFKNGVRPAVLVEKLAVELL